MRFVGMEDIRSTPSDQLPDRESGIQPAPPTVDAVCGDACILRAASQQRITKCDQFGSVATREQSSQEQKCLVLSTTEVPAEVDNQRAHAQASPGFGHERCVSFSPARSRPSLRYLM